MQYIKKINIAITNVFSALEEPELALQTFPSEYSIVATCKDGNCLFASLSHQLGRPIRFAPLSGCTRYFFLIR